MDSEEKLRLTVRVGMVFSPSAPIDRGALFAGRTEQISSVINAIFQRGQHAIIFGERGVGKTSLANCLYDFLQAVEKLGREIIRVNCDASVDFSQLWHNVFRRLSRPTGKATPGFQSDGQAELKSLNDSLPETITPEDIRCTLEGFGTGTIIVIDELDRIEGGRTSSQLADTIKSLSDHSVDTTLILIGVADSVDELISEHRSVERALVQIRMPRMSEKELFQILEKCLGPVGMTIEQEAKGRIARLSQGLPHYTHLLGQHAAQEAVNNDRTDVTCTDVKAAIAKAVESAQQSIVSAYHKAISSPRKNLYPQVLLACAMAPTDQLGYFSANDVREPMTKIMGRPYDIPAFSRHLNDFCDRRRGPVLQKTGEVRRFRFRFINPLMEPFVIMDGLSKELIREDAVNGF